MEFVVGWLRIYMVYPSLERDRDTETTSGRRTDRASKHNNGFLMELTG